MLLRRPCGETHKVLFPDVKIPLVLVQSQRHLFRHLFCTDTRRMSFLGEGEDLIYEPVTLSGRASRTASVSMSGVRMKRPR